ncbi:MAG TPA: FCD domain-containing protein [Ensifer sp.]|nr:FCD domain-containing protein [Ensifer sp.]
MQTIEKDRSEQSEKGSTDQAYERLRGEILAGARAPRSPLRFEQMKLESGFGMSALREALIRLEAEGMVISERHRGFRVAPLKLSELRDINRVRILTETNALELAVAHGDAAWEGEILSALHRLLRQPGHGIRSPASTDADTWEAHHLAFHRALLAACPSEWLLRFAEMLYPQYQRYRRYIWRLANASETSHATANVDMEHREIADRVLQRDAEGAARLLKQHYENNVEMLVRICAAHPGALEA